MYNEYSDEVIYHRCGDFVSRLIKSIEDSEFKEAFVVKGVSLWDTIAPLLAAFILPERVLVYAKNGKRAYVEYLLKERAKSTLKKIFQLRKNRGSLPTTFKKSITGDPQGASLFLNFTPKHFSETFSSVSELLGEEGILIKVIGSYEQSIPKACFLQIPALDNRCLSFLRIAVRQYKTQLNKLKRSPVFDKIKNDFPIEFKVFQDNLGMFTDSVFADAAVHIFKGDILLKCMRPRIIVAGDDCDYRTRAYFLLAKREKIPTLLIQQGLASYKTVDFMFLSTDKIAVIGEDSFLKLLGMGVERDRMIITGRSGFDNLVLPENEIQRDPIITGRPLVKRYILFTSQPFVAGAFKDPKTRNEAVEFMYSLSFTDLPVVIKPHPGEDMNFHRKLSMKYPQAILVDKDSNTNRLVKNCEILVTCSSTTALQAMIAGKPVIIFNFRGCSEHSPYYGSKAVSIASTYEELTKVIKYTLENKNKILSENNKEREDFIKFNTYLPDGNASGRILDIINEMLKSKELKS